MPAALKADVIAVAPELSAVADATFTTYLALSALHIDATMYGTFQLFAHSFLCAHFMTSMGFGTAPIATSPGVSSMTVGPNSISFAGAGGSSSTADFSRTKYGQRFLELREIVTAGGTTIWELTPLTEYDLNWVEGD